VIWGLTDEVNPDDVKVLRAMTMAERLERGLAFMEHARQFKIASVRVHHPGWSEEKVMDEARRWVRDGMKPEQLYELLRLRGVGLYPSQLRCAF
jgi:hypothetical protein